MKEKKGGFFRWPWNVVVYVLLFAALRLFAIPIILILLAVQRKNNPHGVEEGYCLSRTRRRLSWALWSLLWLVISAGLFYMFYVGLQQDRAYWETSDYVTLAVCGGGGVLLLLLGIYMGYTGVRDAFFPGKSALAASIRSQLPYPDEAPPVEELFAMVDADLKANGRWFDEVGIGQEWVLGEQANRIDRIRGIFVVDEIKTRRSGNRTNTQRVLQLVLVDDRWQKHITDFKKPQELRAAADCLALRVPDARRGANGQWSAFWTMDESEREAFERDFRQKQNRRASEAAQREILREGPQDMILKRRNGDVTSRVSASLVEDVLKRCLRGEESGFELTPTRPVEGRGRTFRSLDCFVRTDGGEPQVLLLLEPASSEGGENLALALAADPRRAEEVLKGWLRREVPDLTDWDLRRVYETPGAARPQARKSQAKLSLVYASGAAENHTTFTAEDVQVAADGIVDGTYQLVDLTHASGYQWIRVTAGDKTDGRCTVEATKPEREELGFYITKMPPREAAAWLTGYPRGEFLPGGRDWKRVKKST
nr:hypothetical protein [uncultured Oscillibacter sp.]